MALRQKEEITRVGNYQDPSKSTESREPFMTTNWFLGALRRAKRATHGRLSDRSSLREISPPPADGRLSAVPASFSTPM